MSENLISVVSMSMGTTTIQTVGARELHAFLENRDHFATWIKDRIEQYSFVENQDFTTFSGKAGKGRPRTDYHLSLDMAKELSMVERTAKGKQARQYFIECERRVKAAEVVPVSHTENPVAALSVDICFAQAFFGTFKVADSSKVAILRQIGESHGANTSYLPRLVVDEAPGLPGTSAPTAPLTDLLKARGARVSAREFNLLLALAGYLEQHTRKTTSKRFAERGGVKPFWSITQKGMEFGKNMVAPESPRETVPHWYIHKFDELRERVRPFYRRNLEQAA